MTFSLHRGPFRLPAPRFLTRHRLTQEERANLREYYRAHPAPTPAIFTASLGAHTRNY
ncbi:hypothetical protein [Rhodococcus sp. NPDC127528]|uniref:hypothetical protein n=1 Tax=unclassified Rhodococcus (in: high G+C Gram-positive bacteria) TaxID=192944 RepID=UPI00362EE9AF